MKTPSTLAPTLYLEKKLLRQGEDYSAHNSLTIFDEKQGRFLVAFRLHQHFILGVSGIINWNKSNTRDHVASWIPVLAAADPGTTLVTTTPSDGKLPSHIVVKAR